MVVSNCAIIQIYLSAVRRRTWALIENLEDSTFPETLPRDELLKCLGSSVQSTPSQHLITFYPLTEAQTQSPENYT